MSPRAVAPRPFRLVIDTNIVVAAALQPHGPAARLVRLAFDRRVHLVLSPWAFAEYATVLRMPSLGLPREDVDIMLRRLRRAGTMCVRRGPPVELDEVRDRADLPFMQLALVGRADVLLTRNQGDFAAFAERYEIPALRPKRFLVDFMGEP